MNSSESEKLMKDSSENVCIYMKESRTPYMLTPHLHTEYEIYYSISGGKGFFIDNHYYECQPYDLFIIGKMRVHRVAVSNPDNYVRCVINIDSSVIQNLKTAINDADALNFLDEAGKKLPVKVHLNKEDHEKFLMHIREYLRLEQSDNQLLLTAKLLEILAFVKFSFRDTEGTKIKDSIPEMWSEKAIYFIERNFKDCQTGDVAKALNVNENYLSKVFKSETGTPMNNYIIQRRIAEAKRLLYDGVSVKDVCVASGFNDCSNFIRTFKKITGVSPGSVKKSSAANNR